MKKAVVRTLTADEVLKGTRKLKLYSRLLDKQLLPQGTQTATLLAIWNWARALLEQSQSRDL